MGLIGSIAIATSGAKETTPAIAVTTNPLHCVHVTDVSGRLVNGCYDVTRFEEHDGSLWAVCKLKGICDGVDIDEDCYVPITVGDCDGEVPPRLTGSGTFNCDCVVINFGSCSIVNPRLTIDLNSSEQRCTPTDYPVDLLCSIVTACGSVTTPRIVIASLMNQLL
jgi:hypothetical protein